jgi:hypothetical protein
MRLSNGRVVTWYELAIGGRVTVCDSRAEAFEIIKAGAIGAPAATGRDTMRTITAAAVILATAACAEPAPTPTYVTRSQPDAVAKWQAPAPVVSQEWALLDEVSTSAAPIAAQSAACGLWDVTYWQAKVMRAAVHLEQTNGDALAFSKRFQQGMREEIDRQLVNQDIQCGFLQVMGLEYLVISTG